MHDLLSHKVTPIVNVCNAPLLLSAWSVTTTLISWLDYPPEVRKRTLEAAKNLPYSDTPRGRYEQSRVKPGRGE